MPGISAQQGVTTVNAAGGSSFASPQTGITTGTLVTLALVGATHDAYLWSLAGPAGSEAVLSDVAAAGPTFTPTIGSDAWLVILQGLDADGVVEATYLLPLSIPQVALAYFVGPLALAYVAPATIDTPGIGQFLYQDLSKAGALSAKDASAVTRQVGIVRSGTTGARPATTNLDIGTTYFDTTLAAGAGKPIYWNGTIWVLADGTAA